MALRQNDGATRFSPVDRFSSFPTTRLSVNPSLVSAGNSIATSEVILAIANHSDLSHRVATKYALRRNRRPLFIYLRVGGAGGWIARSRWIIRAEKGTNIADKTPSWVAINCWRGGTITAAPATESPCESIRWWLNGRRWCYCWLRHRRRSWVGCYSEPGPASKFLRVIKRSKSPRAAVICLRAILFIMLARDSIQNSCLKELHSFLRNYDNNDDRVYYFTYEALSLKSF